MTTNSTGSRLWATALAGLTCVGVAGAIAVRVSPAVAETANVAVDVPQAAQTATYTPEQLAAYKQQLDEQAARLQRYEAKLEKVAKELTAAVKSGKASKAVSDIAKMKPATAPPIVEPLPAPAPAPAPAPVPVPDGNSQSSG